jgi:4-hydroxybenzoate polyprenyltransferase
MFFKKIMKIQKFLKTIWNEFVYGGHLLSLGAVSIVFTSSILLEVKITWDFLLIVYLGAQSIYLYDRYKGFKKDILTNSERTKHIEKYVKYIPLIIFFFFLIIFLILIYHKNFSALFLGLFLLIMGLLYSVIFKKYTRKIIGFKTFFVSLMWAMLVILLVVYYSLPLNLALFLLFTFVFLRLIINTNFFDIKDIESDKKEGLLTLVNVWGREKLINILKLLSILAIMPIIIGVYLKILPLFSLMLFFTIPYTFYYLKKSQDKKTDTAFLYNVIVDGEFILWSFFILLGKFLL